MRTKASSEEQPDGAQRFLVTVEREVIVYASSPKEAKSTALHYLNTVTSEQPATRAIKATLCRRLPAVEKEPHAPIIDVAPSRETQK